MMMKIRVFDDETDFSKMLQDQAEKALPKDKFDIGIITMEEFLSAINGLNERRRKYREYGTWNKNESNFFDDVSILFVDFDLFELQNNQHFKADSIAYLVRAFSTCGIIVRVNRFGHNPFDLTLKGDLSSFADFDLGYEQLSNPTLWGILVNDGFSPWYWPNLPAFANDFEKRVKDVENAIKSGISIQDMLGFPSEIWERLPRAIVQFFGSSEANMQLAEFLVESQSALEFKDGKYVVKTSGENMDWTIFSRLAAARISKWLEYTVLKEQDILVDAPHLVSRFPSLLKGGKEIGAWNNLCVRGGNEVPGLDMAVIEPFRLKKTHWVSRPVWFWQGVLGCNEIAEVKEPWNIETPEWVFCEDSSAFYNEDECREFKAETISPFAGRYVKIFPKVAYFPRERFAM